MFIAGTFFTISPENITAMLGYVSSFVGDMMPLLLPIVAVSLGILILWAIIGAIRGH
jgi:divalent metal cation (Fe/Co/Zn/Cd) transporter